MSIRDFIRENRAELEAAIIRAVPNIARPVTVKEIRLWILNDEGLYMWAKSAGVRL